MHGSEWYHPKLKIHLLKEGQEVQLVGEAPGKYKWYWINFLG